MTASLVGRIVGDRIELDEAVPGMEGQRVRVTVEALGAEADEHPIARAIRLAPPDDTPLTAEEKASIEVARRDGGWHTSDEIRARKQDPSGG